MNATEHPLIKVLCRILPFLLAASALAGQGISTTIVDTGQDGFYSSTGSISAPDPGDPFYGQDASFAGNQPDYTITDGGLTVFDNNTGLTWQKGFAEEKLTYSEALDYAEDMNSQNFAGYSDWRVPTIKQLYSLIDFRGTDPAVNATDASGLTPFIDTEYFDFAFGDTSAGERIIDSQWVTTTIYVDKVMGNQTAMFGVNFADGRIKGYPAGITPMGTEKTYYVRLVRGNSSYGDNDFIDNGNGTITDQATGLMWARDDSGFGMTWEAALDWVQSLNDQDYLGYDDWRLPNAKEMQSIVDYSRSPGTTGSAAIDPKFDTTAIVNLAGQQDYPFYWTGTTHLKSDGAVDSAVYIAFGRGMGEMNGTLMDVHGAGCQRSDPKLGIESLYPLSGHGPQGDVQRVFNYVRPVRDAESYSELFSHIADGPVGSGFFRSHIILVNSQALEVSGSLRFYDYLGGEQFLSVEEEIVSEVPFTISARSSLVVTTDGISNPVYVGWARAFSDGPISGMLQYSLEDSSGKPVNEAGIQSSPLQQELTASVQRNSVTGLDTGMALVNPQKDYTTVTIRVKDDSGDMLIQNEFELAPGEHTSMFLSQLGDLPGNFTGTLLIDATSPVGATLIRTVDGIHSSSLPFGM